MSNDHGPIEAEFEQKMKALAQALDELLNTGRKGSDREVGFALLVFRFGDEGRANYISNADHSSMITALKEFVARAEGRFVEATMKQ